MTGLVRRYPMSSFLLSMQGWFLLTAVPSVIVTATGGETTGREAAVLAALTVVSLCGMGVSVWLYRRHLRKVTP